MFTSIFHEEVLEEGKVKETIDNAKDKIKEPIDKLKDKKDDKKKKSVKESFDFDLD